MKYAKNTDFDASKVLEEGTPERIAFYHDMDVMAELLKGFDLQRNYFQKSRQSIKEEEEHYGISPFTSSKKEKEKKRKKVQIQW